MSNSVSDMVTRIRNGLRANKATVECSYSKFKIEILEVLKREGYIDAFSVSEVRKGISNIIIELKYFAGKPAMKEIKMVSKSSRRVYSQLKDLALFYNGLGIYVLSTSKGVMSDYEARSQNVSGEVICSVF